MDHNQRIAFLRDYPKETISPTVMAQVYGGDPYAYNIAAKKGELPFRYWWHGRNLRICKEDVIQALEGNLTYSVLMSAMRRMMGEMLKKQIADVA